MNSALSHEFSICTCIPLNWVLLYKLVSCSLYIPIDGRYPLDTCDGVLIYTHRWDVPCRYLYIGGGALYLPVDGGGIITHLYFSLSSTIVTAESRILGYCEVAPTHGPFYNAILYRRSTSIKPNRCATSSTLVSAPYHALHRKKYYIRTF